MFCVKVEKKKKNHKSIQYRWNTILVCWWEKKENLITYFRLPNTGDITQVSFGERGQPMHFSCCQATRLKKEITQTWNCCTNFCLQSSRDRPPNPLRLWRLQMVTKVSRFLDIFYRGFNFEFGFIEIASITIFSNFFPEISANFLFFLSFSLKKKNDRVVIPRETNLKATHKKKTKKKLQLCWNFLNVVQTGT